MLFENSLIKGNTIHIGYLLDFVEIDMVFRDLINNIVTMEQMLVNKYYNRQALTSILEHCTFNLSLLDILVKQALNNIRCYPATSLVHSHKSILQALYFTIVPRVSWLAYELIQISISIFGDSFIQGNIYFCFQNLQSGFEYGFIRMETSPFMGES